MDIRSRDARKYFIPIEEEKSSRSYCIFCLVNRTKHGYGKTTATTALRNHLKKHNLDLAELFRENNDCEVDCDEEVFEDSVRNYTNRRADIWKYFSKKTIEQEDGSRKIDDDHVYCSLCWNAPIPEVKMYNATTSSGSLRHHLQTRHQLMLEPGKPTRETQVIIEESQDGSCEEVDFEEEDCAEDSEAEVLMQLRQPSPEPVVIDTQYCRSCGRKDAGFFTKLSASFEDPDDESRSYTLVDLYREVIGVTVSQDDGMSQLICFSCESNLKSSFKFKKIALITEQKMVAKGQKQHEQLIEYVEEPNAFVLVSPPPTKPAKLVQVIQKASLQPIRLKLMQRKEQHQPLMIEESLEEGTEYDPVEEPEIVEEPAPQLNVATPEVSQLRRTRRVNVKRVVVS